MGADEVEAGKLIVEDFLRRECATRGAVLESLEWGQGEAQFARDGRQYIIAGQFMDARIPHILKGLGGIPCHFLMF